MNNKKLFLIYFIFLFFFPTKANSSCNFRTADFINDLKIPKEIKEIKITIPKSKTYIQNSLKILLSEGYNIDPKLRKKYKANITVNYPFGECQYKAKVWQNGDHKDHIKWRSSYPLTSLNVKLDEGNILNAVKFKLLIPETRNGMNEILGTLIAKDLGFIAPETFETIVNINGNKSLMIFQEDSRKELLERNFKREGPIFEGDESILWGNYKDQENLTFEELALTRLINWKWFLRGESSRLISINAFKEMQKSYLPYQQRGGNVVTPNFRKNNYFSDYYFLMAIMNGAHGLRPHNRKFYFNALENSFEPIYYDGDLKLKKKLNLSDGWVNYQNAFNKDYYFPYINNLESLKYNKRLIQDFESRVINFDDNKKSFLNDSLDNVTNNAKILTSHLEELGLKNNNTWGFKDSRAMYAKKDKKRELNQKLISSYKLLNNSIEIKLDNNKKEILDFQEFGKLISTNNYKNERYIFIPLDELSEKNNDLTNIKYNIFDGEIIHDNYINFEIDEENKFIKIKQTNPTGWILFNNVKLDDWEIYFEGNENEIDQKNLQAQRFNKYGITGCMNFLNSTFTNTKLKMNNGGCEDSVNIINSKGDIESIFIQDAFQDALDLDFSDLRISNIKIDNAGNDCFDVSGGKYSLDRGLFYNCGDKGLSIGENSEFASDKISVDKSYIGISVKDFSVANLDTLSINRNQICIESKQKKQEFGGAKVSIKNLNCDKFINASDQNSIININKYEL